MAAFQTIVKKTKHGAFYVDIPEKVINSMKLKPFTAAKMKAEKNQIRIFDFQKCHYNNNGRALAIRLVRRFKKQYQNALKG